ncbi:MAG TPA: hypothetical protein VLV83_18205 [Acidobacteriota bacterium]|nr:hypothetical protein [Acidobacteriota bacterium]
MISLPLPLLLRLFNLHPTKPSRSKSPGRRSSLSAALLVLAALALAVGASPCVLAQDGLEVGYGLLDPGDEPFRAAAAALFRLTNADGVVVTEAGVGAVQTVVRGRIFVQQDATNSTGVAFVNASGQTDTLQLTLRDSGGQVLAQVQLTLEPGQHLPRFVPELFSQAPAEVIGTLTFESQHPDGQLAAVTLRQSANAFGEPLLATLPVADLDAPDPQSVLFPQVGAGDGLLTQIVLFDRSAQASQGTIRFFDSQGAPLTLGTSQGNATALPYSIPANGVFFAQLTEAQGSQLGVGYAVVEADQGPLPAGSAIFRFFGPQDVTISEAGVGAAPATDRARILVDGVSTRTGVALANTADIANSLEFDLLDPNGTVLASSNEQIPARGHLARFADEIFDLGEGFTGILEIRAQEPVVPITLKLTTNQRDQQVLTTLPIADLSEPQAALAAKGASPLDNRRVLPQMGIGGSTVGNFSTRMLLLSSRPSGPSGAHLAFRTGQGQPWSSPRRPGDLDFAVGGGELGSLDFDASLTPTLAEPGNETTAVIDIEGGRLEVEDGEGNSVTLSIPPFALLEPATITLGVLNTPPRPTFLQNVYPGVRVESEPDVTLNQPALLDIRLAEPIRNPGLSALFWLDENDQVRALGNQRILANSAQGEINHFGLFTWERLTLSDAMFYAALIAALDPEQRAVDGLPEVDETLREFLALSDDINTLEELRRIRDLLADDDIADLPEAAQLLAEAAQRFLDQDVPDDPCGLYHGFLVRFAALVAELGDADLDEAFRQRIESVDQQCLPISLSGTWLVQSFDQTESCELIAGCLEGSCRWEESEEDAEIEAAVMQTGSAFDVSFPEVPQIGSLTGRLQRTGTDFQPFFFSVADEGDDTLDCLIFFQTQGLGLDFGAPICNAPNTCAPISCQETDAVTAGVSSDGNSFLGIEAWDFTATVEESPSQGPSRILTYRCQGTASVTGTKHEP